MDPTRNFQSPVARGSGSNTKISVMCRVLLEESEIFPSPAARGSGLCASINPT